MKSIDATLAAHLALPVTTTCLLVRVQCVGRWAGTVLGFTNLDIDVTYDDGAGAVTYAAQNGFSPRRLAQTSALGDESVDISQLDGVVMSTGITMQKIRAGLFHSAKVTIYRVNYNDLTAGRHEVLAYGKAGETEYSRDGWTTEFRSLSQWLQQIISQPYSRTCIAKFGSTGVRWACNKAITWEPNGTVTSLGAEANRIFTDSGRAEADDYFSEFTGVVEWLTGDNAGIEMEIDAYTGKTFTLALPLPYPIQAGDTYRPRRDCDKLFTTCRDVYANTDNFRGQNKMPVDGTAMTPGAEINRA